MKILSIVTGIPPENSARIRILKNASILSDNGNDVEFLFYVWKINNKHNLDISFKYSVIEIFRNPLNHFKYFMKIITGKYDVIYYNFHIPIFYLFVNFFKTKIILDRHGDSIYEFLIYNSTSFSFELFFKKLQNFFDLKFSDKIICVSHKMIDDLVKNGVKKNKLFYVTNGVDLKYFNISTKKIRNSKTQNKLVFSYIGAFDKWQGVDNFIKSAEHLKDDPNLIFLIVGGDKNFKDGNIIYLPKVSQKEVLKYYYISDIFVLPRPHHPATEVAAPTKFAEYAAMGKPILTSNVGDAALLVIKYNCGIVIENNAPENIIKGILEFKNKTKDELFNMGKNSRKLAECEFNLNKISKDFIKIIEK